jgi:hypothetical protein
LSGRHRLWRSNPFTDKSAGGPGADFPGRRFTEGLASCGNAPSAAGP